MAALTPVFRANGTAVFSPNNVANPTTLAPNAPAGRGIGDLLVLITECRSRTATVATPTGWNLVPGFPIASATASGGKIYVFTRIATGDANDNASLSWSGVTTGTSGDSSGARIHAWENLTETVDGTIPAPTDAAATTSFNIPAYTTTRNNSVIFGIGMRVNDTAHTFTVATYTERSDDHTTSGTGHGTEVATLLKVTAGAEVARAITPSNTTSSRVLAVAVAFRAKTETTVARLSLAAGDEPATRTAHSVQVRARKTSGTGIVTLLSAIYEGISNRSGNLESAELTTSFADYILPISDSNAASITSYADLELRLWGHSVTGDATNIEISRARLVVPAPVGPTPIALSAELTATPQISLAVIRPQAVDAALSAAPAVIAAPMKLRVIDAGLTLTPSISLPKLIQLWLDIINDRKAQDAFGRSVTDGWGTADLGGAWTNRFGSVADSDVNGSRGTHGPITGSQTVGASVAISHENAEVEFQFELSALPDVGQVELYSYLRQQPSSTNGYRLRVEITAGAVLRFKLQRVVAGSPTDLTTTITITTGFTPGDKYRVKFRISGKRLLGKVWLEGSAEPEWQRVGFDDSFSSGVDVSVRTIYATGGTTPITVYWDNFFVDVSGSPIVPALAFQKISSIPIAISASLNLTPVISSKVLRTMSVALSLTAEIRRKKTTLIEASLSLASAISRKVTRQIDVGLSLVASLVKARSSTRAIDASLSVAPVVIRKRLVPVGSTLSLVPAITRNMLRPVPVGLTLTPGLATIKLKFFSLPANITLVPVMATEKRTGRSIEANLILNTELQRVASRLLSVAAPLTVEVDQSRKISRAIPLGLVMTPAMTLGRKYFRTLDAGLTLVPTMVFERRTGISLSATLPLEAIVARKVTRAISVALNLSPAQQLKISRLIAANLILTPVVSQPKTTLRGISASLVLTPALTRIALKLEAIGANLSLVPDMTLRRSRIVTLNASVGLSVALRRLGFRSMAVGLPLNPQMKAAKLILEALEVELQTNPVLTFRELRGISFISFDVALMLNPKMWRLIPPTEIFEDFIHETVLGVPIIQSVGPDEVDVVDLADPAKPKIMKGHV